MTREEIMRMSEDELNARAAALAEEVRTANADRLTEINAELDAIEERRAQIAQAAEVRARAAAAVVGGAGNPIGEPIPTVNNGVEEIRNSHAYIEAFANYIRTGDDRECRTLLSDNVTGGVVPVPSFVGGIVAERLKASKILSRVQRMEARGNVKVGFEIDAPAATVHTEGGTAQAEEDLEMGVVTIVPQTFKKWVSVSDESLDSMSGEAYLTYIYNEVARGLVKARENAVVAAILAAPQTATATAPSVAKTGAAAGAITDFIDAAALLSDAAEDIVIICSKADKARYKGLAISANYAVDPFDGYEVITCNAATVPIIGDLAGVLENLPKGDNYELKYDDKTRMKQDLVDILGRQPSGIAVVGDKFFAKVSA